MLPRYWPTLHKPKFISSSTIRYSINQISTIKTFESFTKMLNNILTTLTAVLMATSAASTPFAQAGAAYVAPRRITARSGAINADCGVHIWEGKGPGWPIIAEVFAPETEGHSYLGSGGGDTGYGNVNVTINRRQDTVRTLSSKRNGTTTPMIRCSSPMVKTVSTFGTRVAPSVVGIGKVVTWIAGLPVAVFQIPNISLASFGMDKFEIR
jgi:hypothetical protein